MYSLKTVCDNTIIIFFFEKKKLELISEDFGLNDAAI